MATSEGSSRKRHRLFQENNEEFGLETEEDSRITTTTIVTTTDTTTIDTSNSQILITTLPASFNNNALRNKLKSQQFSKICDYFVKRIEKSNGHYEATCSYCKKKCAWGKPAQLEAHLANECVSCPNDILQYWREKVAERNLNYTRKLKTYVLPNSASQTSITSHYMSDRPLSKTIINCLDQKIIKA